MEQINSDSGDNETADFNHLFATAPDPEIQTAVTTSKYKAPQRSEHINQSKWMNWSKNRRQSYQERMKKLEERLLVEEKLKHDTSRQAIRKAKKEASKFIDPQYAIKIKQEKLKTISERVDVDSKPKIFASDSESDDDENLKGAAEDLKEGPKVKHIRQIGVACSFISLVLLSLAAGLNKWSWHSSDRGAFHRGLFTECFTELGSNSTSSPSSSPSSSSSSSSPYSPSSPSSTSSTSLYLCEDYDRKEWTNAVIGLLFASLSMNLLGVVLAVSGLCSLPLLKKLYYFHSASEAFVVSALTIGFAVLTFLLLGIAESSDLVRFGFCPFFCVAAFGLHVFAAVAMNLDVIIFKFQNSNLFKRCRSNRNAQSSD